MFENQNKEYKFTQINHIESFQEKKQHKICVGKIFVHYYIEYKFAGNDTTNLYRAIDQRTTTPVLIREFTVDSKEFGDYLYWEYQFLSNTKHPNMVKAYDFIRDGNRAIVVFEFAEGLSLKDMLVEERKISMLDRIAIAYNIALAMNVFNKSGIILRDIKPANIIINPTTKQIKIKYLGLENPSSKKKLRITLRNKVDEAVMYFSPEQTEGKVSDRSNVFSLGAISYQLFAAKKQSPFYSDNPFSCCYMIGSHHPLVLEKVINSRDVEKPVRKALSETVRHAMAKKSEDRWKDTGQMAVKFAQCYFAVKQQDIGYLEHSFGQAPEIVLSGEEAELKEQDQVMAMVLDIDHIEIDGINECSQENNLAKPKFQNENTQSITDQTNDKLTKRLQYEWKPKRALLSSKQVKYILWGLLAFNAVVALWMFVHFLQKPRVEKNNHPTPTYTVIENLLKEKKYLIATRNLRERIAIFGKKTHLYRDLARCYSEFGEHTKAIRCYDKMLTIKKTAEVYYLQGSCYSAIQSYDSAIDSFKSALTLQKNYVQAALGMGHIFFQRGQYTQAIYYYKASLEMNISTNDRGVVFAQIGLGLLQQRDLENAVEYLSKSIELKPQDAYLYKNRAVAYELMGKKQSAVEDFEKFRILQMK